MNRKPTNREALLRRLDGIADGWTAARIYADGVRKLRETDRVRISAKREVSAAPPRGDRLEEIRNPGAVFESPWEAGNAATEMINPYSIDHNTEYQWGYYRGPATGLYGFTDPYNQGRTGGAGVSLKVSVNGNGIPKSQLFGMGHTHGDYADEQGRRVERRRNAYASDHFSSGNDGKSDMAFMKHGGPPPHNWNFFTLGTPSGAFYQYDPV